MFFFTKLRLISIILLFTAQNETLEDDCENDPEYNILEDEVKLKGMVYICIILNYPQSCTIIRVSTNPRILQGKRLRIK